MNPTQPVFPLAAETRIPDKGISGHHLALQEVEQRFERYRTVWAAALFEVPIPRLLPYLPRPTYSGLAVIVSTRAR